MATSETALRKLATEDSETIEFCDSFGLTSPTSASDDWDSDSVPLSPRKRVTSWNSSRNSISSYKLSSWRGEGDGVWVGVRVEVEVGVLHRVRRGGCGRGGRELNGVL